MVERGRDDSMTTLLSHDNQQDLEIHSMCDECVTPRDTTKNLKHANPDPRHNITTNIII